MELGGRGELVGEDEAAEADGDGGGGGEPAVGDDADVVEGRERVEDGDGEGEGVLVGGAARLEDDVLRVEEARGVDVLDEDPEAEAARAEERGVEGEVGREDEVDLDRKSVV